MDIQIWILVQVLWIFRYGYWYKYRYLYLFFVLVPVELYHRLYDTMQVRPFTTWREKLISLENQGGFHTKRKSEVW